MLFGLERVAAMLDSMNLFKNNITFSSTISFEETNSEKILVLESAETSINSYFRAVIEIEKNNTNRFDIYLGDFSELEEYKKQKKVKDIININ